MFSIHIEPVYAGSRRWWLHSKNGRGWWSVRKGWEDGTGPFGLRCISVDMDRHEVDAVEEAAEREEDGRQARSWLPFVLTLTQD